MVLDIKKAQAAAAKLFPSNVKLKGGAKSVTNKVVSSAQAAKNSGGFFPDSISQGPATPKPMPFEVSTTKPQNQFDQETVTGTGGTRTFTVNGQTTSALAYNASAATIKTALEALSSVANEDVTTTGSAGGPYTMTFAGAFAGLDVLVTTTPSLTGGANTAAVTHPSAGVYVVTLGAGNSGGSFTITVNGQTTGAIAFDATSATVQTALEALSNIGAVSIDVNVTQTGTYVNQFEWTGALKNTKVAFSVDPASLTGGTSTIIRTAHSIAEIIARQETQAALAAAGLLRSPLVVSNDIEKLAQRQPVDIGQTGRIAGEDYGKIA